MQTVELRIKTYITCFQLIKSGVVYHLVKAVTMLQESCHVENRTEDLF